MNRAERVGLVLMICGVTFVLIANVRDSTPYIILLYFGIFGMIFGASMLITRGDK